MAADFWAGNPPGDWRFSRIMGDPNNVWDWRDEQDRPSFSDEANTTEGRTVKDVFPVIRNALAQGNIAYVDQQGQETAGHRVQHLAFISRYEEKEEERAVVETYRVVTVRETEFLPTVRCWAHWVAAHHPHDLELRVA